MESEKRSIDTILRLTQELDSYIEDARKIQNLQNEDYDRSLKKNMRSKLKEELLEFVKLRSIYLLIAMVVVIIDYLCFKSLLIKTIWDFINSHIPRAWLITSLIIVIFYLLYRKLIELKTIIDMIQIENELYGNFNAFKKHMKKEYKALSPIIDDSTYFLFKDLKNLTEEISKKEILGLTEQIKNEREKRDKDKEQYEIKIETLEKKLEKFKDESSALLDKHIMFNDSILNYLSLYRRVLTDYIDKKISISTLSFSEGHVIYKVDKSELTYMNHYNTKTYFDKKIVKKKGGRMQDARLIAAYQPDKYFHFDDKYIALYYSINAEEWLVSINIDDNFKKDLKDEPESVKIKLKDLHEILYFYCFLLIKTSNLKNSDEKKGESDGKIAN